MDLALLHWAQGCAKELLFFTVQMQGPRVTRGACGLTDWGWLKSAYGCSPALAAAQQDWSCCQESVLSPQQVLGDGTHHLSLQQKSLSEQGASAHLRSTWTRSGQDTKMSEPGRGTVWGPSHPS